ncbi:MAG TPA: glycosyltransferase [Candidatus Kryptonia bacterium]
MTNDEMNAQHLPKRVAMVVHAYFPVGEARVKREAELLVRNGVEVVVFCLRDKDQPLRDLANGVHIRRLRVKRHRGASLVVYLFEYIAFLFLVSVSLVPPGLIRKYDVIQFHNPPDFLVFAGLIPKLFGTRLVLDMHEVLPDLFLNRWKLNKRSLVYRVVCLAERLSVGFVDEVMTVSDPVKEILQSRTGRNDISIVMNVIDDNLFSRESLVRTEKSGALRMVYQGILARWYDLTLVLRSVKVLSAEYDLRLDIFGDGPDAQMLRGLVADLGLEKVVKMYGLLPIERIAREIQLADIGLVPMVNAPYYSDLAIPTKLLELAEAGVPAMAPRLPILQRYFDEDMVQYYDPGVEGDFTDKLRMLIADPVLRASVAKNVRRFTQRYSWQNQGEVMLDVMRRLA